MNADLRFSIIKTLAYFDDQNRPLTADELFNCLWQPPRVSRADFSDQLNAGADGVEYLDGFYFLAGRAETIANRRRAVLASDLKMKIARRAAGKICSVPFVRAVFVGNTVSAGTANTDSDIDFFIITAPGRVWIARFFVNLILRLWRLRTYGDKLRDRVCLSFFTDTKHLDLSPYRVAADDIYLPYWIHQLAAVYDEGGYCEKFLEANRWTDKFLPHAPGRIGWLLAVAPGRLGKWWKRAWEKMWSGSYGDLVESQAKGLQLQKIPFSVKERARRADKAVILGDGVVKLHANDRRADFLERWRKKVEAVAAINAK